MDWLLEVDVDIYGEVVKRYFWELDKLNLLGSEDMGNYKRMKRSYDLGIRL